MNAHLGRLLLLQFDVCELNIVPVKQLAGTAHRCGHVGEESNAKTQ